jgi:hypothetical protein
MNSSVSTSSVPVERCQHKRFVEPHFDDGGEPGPRTSERHAALAPES